MMSRRGVRPVAAGALAAVVLAASVLLFLRAHQENHGVGGVLLAPTLARPLSFECVAEAVGAAPGVSTAVRGYSAVGAGIDTVDYVCDGEDGRVWLGRGDRRSLRGLQLDSSQLCQGHPEAGYPAERVEKIRGIHRKILRSLTAHCAFPADVAFEESVWGDDGTTRTSIVRPAEESAGATGIAVDRHVEASGE